MLYWNNLIKKERYSLPITTEENFKKAKKITSRIYFRISTYNYLQF